MSSINLAGETQTAENVGVLEALKPRTHLLSPENGKAGIRIEKEETICSASNATPEASNAFSESAAAPQITKEVSAAEVSAEQETRDVEALGQADTDGPLYSIFTKHQKRYIVFLTAFRGFFSPLSANIYFPALNSLAKDLKVSNELINLTLTSYMIFQGLAPTIFGDLADMTGRRPAYIIGIIIYIAINIGLALQNNYAALFTLRCLQSTGSSETIALGSGVVARIASSGEWGKHMGFS